MKYSNTFLQTMGIIIIQNGRYEATKSHYLIRASMVLVNFFGNNIDDVPGGFEIFT